MQRKDNMPDWVYWGLWGIRSRGAAMAYFVGSLVLSVVLIAGGLMYQMYILCLSPLVPLWYWLAIKWVDKHSSWEKGA